MEDKVKRFIATGIMVLLAGLIVVGAISSLAVIQKADTYVQLTNTSLNANPDSQQHKVEYNEAVKNYYGAVGYFPGNLLGIIYGYTLDKWCLVELEKTSTWSQWGKMQPLPDPNMPITPAIQVELIDRREKK